MILTREEFNIHIEKYMKLIDKGAIFIHPTDTIYGLGCNALNKDAVKKIRKIKKRYTNPFSVIVPSKDWIKKNCIINKDVEKWLKKLPGPYTLILKLKNKNCIAKNVNNDLPSLGVRIPAHWFSDIVTKLQIPIITTSVNITGETFMTSIENLNPEIKKELDFIIYEGEKYGRPSKIIDLTSKETIIER